MSDQRATHVRFAPVDLVRPRRTSAERPLLQSPSRAAPIVDVNPLRQPRRHYAARAGSDDAHAAPARKRFIGAVASDAPRDGLSPGASTPRAVQCGLHPPAPRGSPSHSANRRTPSLGAMAHPMVGLPAGSPIGANAACRGGQQQHPAQNGSGVPCPLWFSQRRGVRDGQKH